LAALKDCLTLRTRDSKATATNVLAAGQDHFSISPPTLIQEVRSSAREMPRTRNSADLQVAMAKRHKMDFPVVRWLHDGPSHNALFQPASKA
jgi:hypothetical protein